MSKSRHNIIIDEEVDIKPTIYKEQNIMLMTKDELKQMQDDIILDYENKIPQKTIMKKYNISKSILDELLKGNTKREEARAKRQNSRQMLNYLKENRK